MQARGLQQALNGLTHFYIVINDEYLRSTREVMVWASRPRSVGCDIASDIWTA